MSKWRVTFEVDLTGLIPKQEDLKPHDYPLTTWASDAVFQLLFKRVSVDALERKLDVLACGPEEPHKAQLLAAYQRIHELAEQAGRSAKVEEIK